MFTEGWVEFTNKRIAKHVADTLNTTRIGNVLYMSQYHDPNNYYPIVPVLEKGKVFGRSF